MSRPVKRRTVKSYRRDVEHLTRLQTAIKLDAELDRTLAKKATEEIDILVNTLIELIVKQESA